VHLLGGLRLEPAGLHNWARFLTDSAVWQSWLLSLVYFVLTVGIEMLLGVALALCLWRVLRGRNVLLSVLLLPMFVAPVIVGLIGRFLTDSTFGLYAWVFARLGFTDDVFATKTGAFAAVTVMDVWEWTPLVALITLAGLSSVSQSVLEAAAIDGAHGWRLLRSVVFPSISNVLLVALLIRAMDAIRYFDIITITTNGGPANGTKIIPVRLFETAFRFLDFGYAAVLGLVMLAFSVLIAQVFVRILDRKGLAR
jgi:multiple sugar transport system permease protein